MHVAAKLEGSAGGRGRRGIPGMFSSGNGAQAGRRRPLPQQALNPVTKFIQ